MREPFRVAFCPASEASRLIQEGLDSWLSQAETSLWQALSSPKRRLDWLCGRVAAKRALGSALAEIFNEPDGRPFARGAGRASHISISHCAEGGAAVVSDSPVGIDYESVAERAPRVLELYLHPDERGGVQTPEQQTALWSLKEAVLKLLGLGLAGGLTDVRFSSPRERVPALFGAAQERWRALGRPPIETSWRREGPAVLALAWCPQGA